ncbi:MAG: HDOD domain-containing protein [Spirochaetia bacterium]|jgi:putative nucleotidyltransferase with HDIG domain|nr:HDOD domain-containing protein [Spirochaetia bacterium]
MDNNERLRIIEKYIKGMPSLPVTVTKVKEICDNPRTSPMDLYKVISLDPVLMGKVMKLINSAYYGISGRVTSLVRAIIMLGMNTVKNLALSSSVMGIMSEKTSPGMANSMRFWQHSLCTGIAAKILARETGKDRHIAEEYFIAGMLHDIGKIPILSCFPDEYKLIIADCAKKKETMFDAEKRVFNFDHTLAGQFIARQWSLGDELESVIAYHHEPLSFPDDKYRDIVYTIAIAEYFTNTIGYSFVEGFCVDVPDKEVFKWTGITEEMLKGIEETIVNELEKARAFLDFKE